RLRGLATSAIDVSDGLLGDLGHVLQASGVGACVEVEKTINLIAASTYGISGKGHFDLDLLYQCALTGGDDYELAFTAAPSSRAQVEAAARQASTPVARIGQIEAAPGLRLVDGAGRPLAPGFASFDHFA
ncbi:MAG: thiamine-phosphate kinase, partial [Giesbergeria sp.]